MAKLIISTVLFVFICTTVVLITKNEVVSSYIQYVFEDITTEHGNKNLMLGSSTIKKLNQKKYLNCGRWLNRGIGNSTISNLSTYLSVSPLSINPSQILLYAGENDISRGLSSDETTNTYKKFLSYLSSEYPDSSIHVLAIKPSPKRQAHWSKFSTVNNTLEAELKDMENVTFHTHPKGEQGFGNSSFIDDGIHLTEEGYSMLTAGLREICKTN